MSKITMESFGEQTLDALLEAESISDRKNILKKSGSNRAPRFKIPSLAPLQEISENLVSNYSTTKNLPSMNEECGDKPTTNNDDTNIDKYFQDSLFSSKIDNCQVLCREIDSTEVVDPKNKSVNAPTKVVGNRISLKNKAGCPTRSSNNISMPRKAVNPKKSRSKKTSADKRLRKNRIELLEESFVIESSQNESSSRYLSVLKQTELRSKDSRINITTSGKSPEPEFYLLDNESKDSKKYAESSLSSDNIQIDNDAMKSNEIEQKNEIKGGENSKELFKEPIDTHSNIISGRSESSTNLDRVNSIICTQDRCKLSAWGLPPDILQKYESRGMKTMFPWQVECLSNYQVLEENKNLVYSAPTSAGKTLVAELLVIKTVLERQKKVIFILPFVSVVREKMFYFQDLLSTSGIRVEGFMGGIAPAGGLAAAHIAIATIEKANSLINRLMEEGGLPSLGAVVIDELHLLGDPHRGYLLELLLTKLKYMTLREEHVKIQLIGMSATLPNLPLLAEWLDAALFDTDFRPVPLNERYKISRIIYSNKFTQIRELDPSPELPNDSDNILQLCIETIAGGHSTLIFCPTKNWCEKLAHQVAGIFFKLGSGETTLGKILREQLDSNAIEETLSQLKRCPAGLDYILKSTVSFGVAFHHAGLTMDERDIIEGSFRTGSLRVLIATSTLSSGVNLPARRVIIRSLMFHGKVIDTLTYRQMIGRAGRMGKDTAGESILICKQNEKNAVETLLSAPLDPVESCLEDSAPLIRALLEAVASEVACTPSEVNLYSRCTLASFSAKNNVENLTKEAMKFLTSNEFIIIQETKEKEQRWVATALGKACLASSVSPGDGLFLFEELQRARKSFVLETELHLIYLVTPFNSGSLTGQIDWMIFFNLWKSLSECERRVGQMVGIEERFIMSAIRGIVKIGKQQNIHRRFFTALALHDLVREIPLTTVSEKYGCSRGVLQSLQQSASTLAGMVTQFCKQLGWDCMELLFCQFQARLQFGVSRELLDLLRLPMLNGLRARSLYKEGIKSVADLAIADDLSVERALHRALPFESEKEQDGEHMLDAAKRNKVRSIFVTGRDGLTPYQAAVMLVQEARTLVQRELGVKEVQWKQDNETSNGTLAKSYDKSSTSFSRNSDSDLSNNPSIGNIPLSSGSAALPLTESDNLYTENSRNINEIPKTIDSSVDAIGRSEDFEKRSKEIMPTENKIVTDSFKSTEEKDSGKNLRRDTSRIIRYCDETKTEKSLNKTARNKPKFDLLGMKRKSKKVESNPEAVPRKNEFKRNPDHNVFLSPTKFSGGTVTFLGNIHRMRDNEVVGNRELLNTDVKYKSSKTEAHESVKNVVDSKVERPSKVAKIDLKLSISPVVTLEWLTFDDRVLNKKSSNDKTEFPRLERASNDRKKESTFNEIENLALSRSPSLFGDSLYLDSQFCNELERNVDGSLDVDKIRESKSSASLQKSIVKLENEEKSSPIVIVNKIVKTSDKQLSSDKKTGNNHIVAQNGRPKHPDFDNPIPNSEDINFSWNSTEWDEVMQPPNLLGNGWSKTVDKICQRMETPIPRNCDDKLSKENIVPGKVETRECIISDDFNMSDEIAATPIPQTSRFKSISSKSYIKNLRNVKLGDESDSRKRKYNALHSVGGSGPVEGKKSLPKMRNHDNKRRLSFDSNKSDSEDIIVASQDPEPIKGTGKNRTRLHLESSKRVAVNKKPSNITLAESLKQANGVKNKNIELLRTGGEIPRKVVYQENCSPDSIVSNSDEDSPVRRLRVAQSLHKRTLNSSFNVQKIKNLQGCEKRCLKSDDVKEERSTSEKNIDWDILDIVNVTWNDKIFNLFSSELKQKTEIAIALAYDKFVNDTVGIGTKLVVGSASDVKKKFKKNESCIYSDTIINGVAISWGRNVVYYISFENRKEGSISLKDRLQLVRDVLTDPLFTVRCYASKDAYKKLHQCCSITPNCTFLDPNVAEWLLEPDNSERNLHDMAKIYFPRGTTVLQHANSLKSSAGTSSENKQFLLGRHKAAAEAAVTWHVMDKLMKTVHSRSKTLLNAFRDVETKVASTLARMELTGIGINLESLQELSEVLHQELSSLEKRAYSLAGRKFSFTSSKEVAQVLGMYKGVKVSTNKAVLENCDNPISNLVISWRKLNTTQTKMVFPLLNLAQQGPRVRGCCVTHTATGRISMHEPNLQNVPRDFESESNSFVISMRMAFVPTCGNIMLSADYCQLELRILAHFSNDPVLCEIMRTDSDIFKNIAAQWNQLSIEDVTDDIRQRTKQLCYGIIYGMGSKALSKQLSVTQLEASQFMDTFMATYPNVSKWLDQVITQSREDGYVTTLMERRRLLPGLNSEVKSERSQAERQAVNTKIQGSAADLAKKAMVIIDEKLQKEYPDSSRVLLEVKTRRLRSSKDSKNRGAYLVLQLHDELLYEVNAVDLDLVASIVKTSMEEAYQLRIPLPVKIKVGPTWGSLTEYKI